ncbi:MAG: flagellar basal-body rod protein FlgG [Planctomycetota bacterium]
MSLRALHTGGTGMQAYGFNLDVVANNLANAGTTGFKRSRSDFQDLFYEQVKPPGALDTNGIASPVGVEVGLGVRVAGTKGDFSQGNLVETGNQFDLAIAGDGFFRVNDLATGQFFYTRSGTFSKNAEGSLVMSSADIGRPLDPQITIPEDATEVSISGDGVVNVFVAGDQTPQEVGRIQLARFINPAGLLRIGETLFQESGASGVAIEDQPGLNGLGQIRQNFLENSNVEPVRELVDLIKTQRNFELNGQVVQAADQSLQLVTNLRRF